jgi:hypothetical protein
VRKPSKTTYVPLQNLPLDLLPKRDFQGLPKSETNRLLASEATAEDKRIKETKK